MVSCDGSFDGARSGWGFTVAKLFDVDLKDYCGPTVLDTSDRNYIGALQHSNHVGELSALHFALKWIRDNTAHDEQVILEYEG